MIKREHYKKAITHGLALGILALWPSVPGRGKNEVDCHSMHTIDPRMTADGEAVVPATRRVAGFGAVVLSYIAERCQNPRDGDSIIIMRPRGDTLSIMLTQQVGSTIPGATEGSYYASITAVQDRQGEYSHSVMRYSVAQSASYPHKSTAPTFMLRATKRGLGWSLRAEQQNPRLGTSVIEGVTSGSLSDRHTQALLEAANTVVTCARNNTATGYAPTN